MARVSTKIGDVFSVKLDNNSKKYFQLIAFDLTQLNSDVIRAFKKTYPTDSNPDLSEIVKDEVEFYAHCITKLGVKMNLWEKIGNNPELGDISKFLFRATNDYGTSPGKKMVSSNWFVRSNLPLIPCRFPSRSISGRLRRFRYEDTKALLSC